MVYKHILTYILILHMLMMMSVTAAINVLMLRLSLMRTAFCLDWRWWAVSCRPTRRYRPLVVCLRVCPVHGDLSQPQSPLLSQAQTEEGLRKELLALQEDKHNYETTAKESLRRVLQEKIEVVRKLSEVEVRKGEEFTEMMGFFYCCIF